MARQNVEGMDLDVTAILQRLCDVGGFDGIPALAKYLGLSAQALRQAADRKSIALAPLLKIRAKSGASLDYLVYGGEQQNIAVDADDSEYVEVGRDNGNNIKVLSALLRSDIDPAKLRAYVRDDNSCYIINTADKTLGAGMFAFGQSDAPVIRRCLAQIDGSFTIEGEDISKQRVVLLGRVVLTMTRPPVD